MLVLGAVLKRLGWKITMMVGVLGHAARFAVFAYLPEHQWLVVSVNVLHGICYAFFFATVYIFVDEFFPKDARASAQGLFNVMILGIGVLVANTICPVLIQEVYNVDGVVDFKGLFMLTAYCALAATLLLAFCFWPPKGVNVPKEVSH
jgi:MFS family permease